MFHEAPSVQSGGAWCDVFNQALMFPNAKDDLPQLFLKDVKGQFTCASMQKPT
jgi:hypothetical protein